MGSVKLDPLFKKSSTGKLCSWSIDVVGDTYFETYGYVGMKQTTTPGTKCEPKNVGRANALTAEQQAQAEAKSKWEKKQKSSNYMLSPDAAMRGDSSELVEGGLLPMLAHKFSDQAEKLVYPCFVQPKLDGHRCIAMPEGSLWSRTRKPIMSVPHINLAVQDVVLLKEGPLPLDGELYTHEYRAKFEELTHFIRQSQPELGCEIVQYHIYDVVAPSMTFRQRLAYMKQAVNLKAGPIKLVDTIEVANEDELMVAFEDFLAQGYEGAIARNADGLYVGKRSYDLLKIKQFDDAEFLCIGVEEGRGKLAGHAIFVCDAGNEVSFRAKMKGEQAALKKYFSNPGLVVDRQVTVKYQGKTKYGIPRFPVAIRIREE
jgi:ATP-dependent DNA ligase